MALTQAEIGLLLECLSYGIQRVGEARETPTKVRQENLQRLRGLEQKLRQMRERP